MEEVFSRVSAQSVKNYKNTALCVVGRVETFSKERIHLDCGTAKVQVLTNNKPPGEIAQNDILEVRGEQLSDNILILSECLKLGADFDLVMYNKALELMVPAINSYSSD